MSDSHTDTPPTTARFWLRPKWIVGHVLCAFLVVLFVNLGFWQLRRLHERQHDNQLIRSRVEAPVTTLDAALRHGGPQGAAYRRVRVSGTWVKDTTVLVRNRSLDGQPGDNVVTTLDLGGRGLVVLRGFAPLAGGGLDAMRSAVRPGTSGPVTITGVLRTSEKRGAFGPRDPATGTLEVLNRIDLGRIQQQQALELAPVYLQLTSSRPAEKEFVREVPLPPLSDGPHLSYAIQWFIFATIGAIGWPLLLRKTARGERSRPSDPEAAP
jgi:cytochrome oxidase assembly protein ShyY1